MSNVEKMESVKVGSNIRMQTCTGVFEARVLSISPSFLRHGWREINVILRNGDRAEILSRGDELDIQLYPTVH